jgi:alkylation response protein AidB-like acyl-CoA dehydrogenase
MVVEFPAEKQDLLSMVRDFLAKRCPPDLARACDEESRFPHELYRQMGDLGWQGIPFSADVGGSEGDPLDEAIVVEQLGRAMGPLASAYVISVLTCGKTVRDLGTPEQQQRWLPPVIAGTSLLAFALTEPGAGSDAAAITTRAVKREGGWLLNGQKIFCTGASLADNLLVMARTADGSPKRSISMFVVRTDAPGVTINNIPKLGLHPYPSSMIFFEDVALDDADLLGEPGDGWPHLVSSLNRERLAISAMCAGMARAALDAAVAYAGDRKQFGTTITGFDAVRQHIADIAIDVESARALMLRAARLESEGKPSTLAASVAKIRTTDACVNAARLGMQVLGGYGYTNEYPMQRFLRDGLIHPIAGGSNEIQRNIIAGELLADTAPAMTAPPAAAAGSGDLGDQLERLTAEARTDLPAALAELGALVLGAGNAGPLHGLLVTEDREPLLAPGSARAIATPDGWVVSGSATLLGSADGPDTGMLVPLEDGDGGLLLRIDPAAVLAGRRPGTPGAAPQVRLERHVVESADAIAELDGDGMAALRAVLGVGATAILVGIADVARQQLVDVVRERGAGSERWSGQSLKHRLADAYSQRDVAWLEMHRAVESELAATRSLHAAVGLHEGLDAANRSVTEAARAALAVGDDAGVERAAAAAAVIATLDGLAGGPYRLKERVAERVLPREGKRAL